MCRKGKGANAKCHVCSKAAARAKAKAKVSEPKVMKRKRSSKKLVIPKNLKSNEPTAKDIVGGKKLKM